MYIFSTMWLILVVNRTALNLLTAYAVALKHKLRFEPYTHYEDLTSLVGHLDTFASHATKESPGATLVRRPNKFKAVGEYLGVSFATSNPRKAIKKATRPLGNLPLEIMGYLASFVDEVIENGQLTVPMQQTLACKSMFRPTLSAHPGPCLKWERSNIKRHAQTTISRQ